MIHLPGLSPARSFGCHLVDHFAELLDLLIREPMAIGESQYQGGRIAARSGRTPACPPHEATDGLELHNDLLHALPAGCRTTGDAGSHQPVDPRDFRKTGEPDCIAPA